MIRLTERDRKFLKDLYLVKYLNTKRICRLYQTVKNCQYRLKQMVKVGYIKVIDCTECGEFVYCISKKGCNILSVCYTNTNKPTQLSHSLACSDFYCSIRNKSPTSVQLEIQYYFKHSGRKYSFRPDILINIDRWYFIEIDLSGRRFDSKVESWEAFYESEEYLKYFEKYPPIIIVTTNVEKVKGIIDKLKKVELNYVYKDYNQIKEW